MTTEVRDSGGLHKYRTEIPNMVLDMGLDAYTFRLYCHLKRVAGDEGMCWQSTRTISEATNMSVGQVSKSKKVLEEKGLITCERGGPTTSDSVTIIDVWLKNMEVYSKRSQRSPHEHERSPDEHERSPHEPKKNHSKKNQVKNTVVDKPTTGDAPPRAVSAGQFYNKRLAEILADKRATGKTIHTPTEREKKDFGDMAKTAFEKDGYTWEEIEQAIEFQAAKAAGEIDGEPAAWCGFRTALIKVTKQGWRPGQGTTLQITGAMEANLRAAELKKQRAKDNQEMADLYREIGMEEYIERG